MACVNKNLPFYTQGTCNVKHRITYKQRRTLFCFSLLVDSNYFYTTAINKMMSKSPYKKKRLSLDFGPLWLFYYLKSDIYFLSLFLFFVCFNILYKTHSRHRSTFFYYYSASNCIYYYLSISLFKLTYIHTHTHNYYEF
jgi:hypothetical protein